MLLGASAAGGFSTNASTQPLASTDTTPNREGSSRREGDGGHPVPLSVELEQGRNVYLSQDVPVDDDERLVADTGLPAAKAMAPAVSSGVLSMA